MADRVDDRVGEESADEVDRIVAAWQRERPDLDVAPLEVLSRVTRLAHHLDHARRHAFERWGLAAWEFDVLSALRRSGDPYQLTAGELVRQTLVTSGTMTNRIDRLVSRGLVARAASENDRRAVLITLTQAGRDAVDGALSDLVDDERDLLQAVSEQDRVVLADLLRRLVVPFEGS